MRKDVIRLSRRRRPRVHIIEQDMTRRAVRDASCSACREHSLTPMLVLTRTRPGGHHERHPLAINSDGPPLTRKATLEIYTVAASSQDLPPGCFTPPPGGGFRPPPGTEHPPGVFASTPGGGFGRPSGYKPPPGAREALPGGRSLSGRECDDVRDPVGAVPDLRRDRP